MNHLINELIAYGIHNQLIKPEDIDYSANLLIDLLELDEFEYQPSSFRKIHCILEDLLKECVKKGLVEDTITSKDLFDTRIMNCLLPRPSEVVSHMNDLYHHFGPRKMSESYYQFSIASNYIRQDRIDKNIHWLSSSRYGDIEMSINLSKPEKDPKEIAKAKLLPSSNYPKCLLCKENVGFAGNFKQPARQNHRILPVKLEKDQYYMQYSPYVYYQEHCIIFNEQHIPMHIDQSTFEHLLAFIDYLPHYFLGSNADLPIVGGSILTHDHYQGGHHHFPIEKAKVLASYTINPYQDVCVDLIEWPLSTLRLTSSNKEQLVLLGNFILQQWIQYSDEIVDIQAFSGQERHNTITPIARKVNDNYQLDLVLRNNRCNETYPDGIFHPHQDVHHIKKENIGLIEVMGLAILPARLKDEMSLVEKVLLGQMIQDPSIEKHQVWIEQIKNKHVYTKENVSELVKQEIGNVFVRVLEDAGVYKMNEQGIQAFKKFIESVGGTEWLK